MTNKHTAQVPKLRFPGFEGEWNAKVFEKELIESKLGGDYANSEIPTPHPLIKMGNLGRGSMNLDKLEYIQDTEVIDPDDEMKPGDLFFNTRNTLDLVGKVAIWRSELPKAYFNSNILRITFGCNAFMNYRLNSWGGLRALRRLATGTTSVAAIYNRDLFKMRMALPTLPEQQKIAGFLTAVDGRIEQLSRKKALLEATKKGVMQQLFTQTLRFQDDHGHDFPDWEEKTVDAVAECLDNLRRPVNGADREKMKGDIPYYGANGIQGYVNDFLFDEELTLLAEDGGNFDEFATRPIAQRISGKAWVNNHAHILRAKRKVMTPDFLFYSLVHKDVRQYINGSSRAKLNKGDMLNIEVVVPSLPEQKKIAGFLSALDGKIAAVGEQLSRTHAWKKGLLQQMFV